LLTIVDALDKHFFAGRVVARWNSLPNSNTNVIRRPFITVADREILKGGVENVSASSSFIAKAHNDYMPFIREKTAY